MHALERRVRMRRCLGRLRRFAWIAVIGFLLLYASDWWVGWRILSLRVLLIASGMAALTLFAADLLAAWYSRLDRLGLAQLVEESHPEFGGRLLTLVQVAPGQSAGFAEAFRADVQRRLGAIDADRACPWRGEWRRCGATAIALTAIFAALMFAPSFGRFSQRFFGAWTKPLVPYEISVMGGEYALRDGSHTVTAVIHPLDEDVELPATCTLVGEDDSGGKIELPMQSLESGRFAFTFSDLRRPLRFHVEAGEAQSEVVSLGLVDAPSFAGKPAILALPPAYAKGNVSVMNLLGDGMPTETAALRYSKLHFHLPIKDCTGPATLHITRLDATGKHSLPIVWRPDGMTEMIAAEPGVYRAEAILELQHGLRTALPVGQFTVRDDRPPRFAQGLRLAGSDAALRGGHPYRIAPGTMLKMQGLLEDDEGLDGVVLEYRLNEEAPVRVERWLNADGHTRLPIDHWLPLPKSLKDGDLIRLRLHVRDNRRLKRDEIGAGIPTTDVGPHLLVMPGDGAWFEFRVEQTAGDLARQFAEQQADDIKDLIGKIKEKVQAESDQAKRLQRTIHQQAVLTPLQVEQAEKLQALDRIIAGELFDAGKKLALNPELAKLAEHFFDIADVEMSKSAAGLKQFRERGRTLADAERDLQDVQDSLGNAERKLDRMLGWNKRLAQDRLDRWQLEKLAQRQDELAERLAKMLAELSPGDAERAKEIEAIRAEQAKLAEEAENFNEQGRLGQESAQSDEQMRLDKLAQDAEQLAAERKALGESAPEKATALRKKADALMANLLELAQKGGPEMKEMAKESAEAIGKAMQAMDVVQEKKAKNDKDEAKKMDDDAAKALDVAVKNLAKLAEEKAIARAEADKTVQALKESVAQMRKAEAKLPKMPKDAQLAMKSAAEQLAQTVQQASKQSARSLPNPARQPAAKASAGPGGSASRLTPLGKLEPFDGKSWGELPGELKTQMLQDFRARYGAEHAEIIRQYFERLAQTPDRKE